MRVTWITANHPPAPGGMARSSARIAHSLQDAEIEVTVMRLRQNPEEPISTANARYIDISPDDLREPERIFWRHRAVLDGSLLVGFGGSLAGYYATLWGRWLRCRSMVLFRGNDFDRTISDLRRGWIVHFILEHADMVGAVSREMCVRIGGIRRGPVLFTPNSIDTDEWRPLAADHENAAALRRDILKDPEGRGAVVSIFGELKSKKGLDLALAVFASFGLKERAHLLTVGRIPESMAEKLTASLNGAWTHIPFRERETLPPLYLASDAVFLPSHYDGMPNVLLEAMALGRIPVTSDTGAFPDVIRHGENGFLFPAGDIATAARTLHEVLSLPDERRMAVSEAAMKTVHDEFSPSQETRIILGALREME